MLKKIAFAGSLLLLVMQSHAQTLISPQLFGINAWMPDTIGTSYYNGKLHQNWQKIKASKPQFVRYGGIAVDIQGTTRFQYLRMIDSIRINGMEPIIQVPASTQFQPTVDLPGKAHIAADIVRLLKNLYPTTPIRYFVIGNEPEGPGIYGYGTDYNKAYKVAPYIKQFADSMKAVDSTIKIIAPGLSEYRRSLTDSLLLWGYAHSISGKVPGHTYYYIDYYSFHSYAFGDTIVRDSVITKLRTYMRPNLTHLDTKLNACNANRADSPILPCITEFNIAHENLSTDGPSGKGTNSFIAGQYWAEMLSLAMEKKLAFVNFWSVVEGNSQVNSKGYLNRSTHEPLSTYYHFQLLSGFFNNEYKAGTDKVGGSDAIRIKAFGCKRSDNWYAAMILNQDSLSTYPYAIHLNTTGSNSSYTLNVNIDASKGSDNYFDTIPAQSTVLLVFDTRGHARYRCIYKLNGHADSDKAPECRYLLTDSATVDKRICPGDSALLDANAKYGTPPYTYLWTPSGGLSSASSATPKASPSADQTYTVKVTDAKGATATSSVPVIVQLGSATDAHMKDTDRPDPHDDGTEPNTVSGLYFISRDIWTRNSPDTPVGSNRYANEHTHYEPEYAKSGSFFPYIYVKLRNTGCLQVTGKMKIYYANASTALSYPGNFIPVDSLGPVTLSKYQTYVFESQWRNVPNPQDSLTGNNSHYCLFARFVSTDDPIDETFANSNPRDFKSYIANNNNVVLKNLTVRYNPNRRISRLNIGNPTSSTDVMKLKFTSPDYENGKILTHTDPLVDLGPVLFGKWEAGGKVGSGIQHPVTLPVSTPLISANAPLSLSPYTIRILSGEAYIGNISLNAGEMHTIGVDFYVKRPASSPSEQFSFDIRQFSTSVSPEEEYSGERYLLTNIHCATPVINVDYVGSTALLTVTIPTALEVESIQWQLNSLPVPGATEPVFIATAAGTYTILVRYRNSGCSQVSNPVNISFSPLLRKGKGGSPADDPHKNSPPLVSVYPNPTEGAVNIGLTLSGPALLTLELYNLSGQLLQSIPGAVYEAGVHKLVLTELRSGVYLLKGTLGDAEFREKVVVIR